MLVPVPSEKRFINKPASAKPNGPLLTTIKLSSMVKTSLFIDVVVPLIVKLPATVREPVKLTLLLVIPPCKFEDPVTFNEPTVIFVELIFPVVTPDEFAIKLLKLTDRSYVKINFSKLVDALPPYTLIALNLIYSFGFKTVV